MIENKFTEGTTVYALAHPNKKLIIKRYIKRIYYCTSPAYPDQKDMVFYERELTDVGPKASS
ncbi:MAG: hypothetical protein RIB86_13305 [Imperialibacter sp.]